MITYVLHAYICMYNYVYKRISILYHIPKYTRAFLLFFREKSHSTTITHLYTFFVLSFRTYVHTFLHHMSGQDSDSHTFKRACVCICLRRYIRTYVRTYIHGIRHTYVRQRPWLSYIWTYLNILTRIHVRTYMRTYVHTGQRHICRQPRPWLPSIWTWSLGYIFERTCERTFLRWTIYMQTTTTVTPFYLNLVTRIFKTLLRGWRSQASVSIALM